MGYRSPPRRRSRPAGVILCRKSGLSELFQETAQHIANHESPRTTMLYDRRQEEISLDEVERIAI